MQHYLNETWSWREIRRTIGMFIPKRYRRCKICDKEFAHGVLRVDNGYLSEAVCGACYDKACEGDLEHDLVAQIEGALRF